MFIDGLYNRVAIYNLSDVGGRLDHDKVLDSIPKYKEMACRIVKDDKVLFEEDIILKQGDVLYDLKTKKQYNLKEVKRINGLNGFHHLSCKVDLRRVGDLNERTNSQHRNQSERLSKLS